jgi:hypothetical protein
MKARESLLVGSGLILFKAFWASHIEEIAEAWEAVGLGERAAVVNEYERWREKAFIGYKPLVLTQASFEKSFLEIAVLRDLILVLFFNGVSDRSLLPFFSEVWRESLGKANSFLGKLGKLPVELSQGRIFFTPERKEGSEVDSSIKSFFNTPLIGLSETPNLGKLYLFSEGDSADWWELVYVYPEESKETFKFIWNDCIVALATLSKLNFLVGKYQGERLQMINEKKSVDSYVQEVLNWAAESGNTKLSDIERTCNYLSQHAAWLTAKGREAKNLATALEGGLNYFNNEFLPYFSEAGFFREKINLFTTYRHQALRDHDYLRLTLQDVEIALRNLRTRADILHGQLQENFRNRLFILFFVLFVVVLLALGYWIYSIYV